MIKDFLIVHKDIVPKNVMMVLDAQRLVEKEGYSVSDACKKVDISRGTFYKYKDMVFLPSHDFGKKAIFTFTLENKKGVLSNLLNYIAARSGNVLSINQEMPINGEAFVTLTIDVIEVIDELNTFILETLKIDGVRSAKLLAIE
ncbi:MAG: hypothetical protein J5666_04630 [Bacilli bacterium]|nr:hypothetical protein [Bacilli bacterium]